MAIQIHKLGLGLGKPVALAIGLTFEGSGQAIELLHLLLQSFSTSQPLAELGLGLQKAALKPLMAFLEDGRLLPQPSLHRVGQVLGKGPQSRLEIFQPTPIFQNLGSQGAIIGPLLILKCPNLVDTLPNFNYPPLNIGHPIKKSLGNRGLRIPKFLLIILFILQI